MVTFIVISVSFSISTRDNFRGKGSRDIAFYIFPRCPTHVVPVETGAPTVPTTLETLESIPLDVVIGPTVDS